MVRYQWIQAKFVTKPMNEEMYKLGKDLQCQAVKQFVSLSSNTDVLSNDYNHCTILIYHHYTKNTNYKLSYHCDSAYNHQGTFLEHNTMIENSAVLVFTLGDNRDINFKKRLFKSAILFPRLIPRFYILYI